MKRLRSILIVSVAFGLHASPVEAQWFSIGLRGSGSVPTGEFGGDAVSSTIAKINGARNGFGYGLDVGLGVGMFGLYGGFDHIKFDCRIFACASAGKYILSGASAGLKLAPFRRSLISPFVKSGVTFNQLEGGYGEGTGSQGLTSNRAPGYELGAGIDVALLGLVTFTPQMRYIGQQLKVKIPGVMSPPADGQGVNYLSFDVGLTVHTPFGSLLR
jgi:hypothetical protein